MRKYRQRMTRADYRRQGVVLFILIIILILSIMALATILLVNIFSGNGTKATDTVAEPTTGISSTLVETTDTQGGTSDPTGDSAPETTIFSETAVETTVRIPPTIPATIDGPDLTGYTVVLDPGGQMTPNLEQEPLMPVMSGSKDKTSEGGVGVITGRPESEINLEIAILARDYLESLGCTVYLTRTVNDIDMSNIERAQFALSQNPDAYIRLYCNSDSDPDQQGIQVSVADSGKYKDRLVGWGELLGTAISEATGESYNGCDSSSFYSGLNWATDIPGFMLKMGYLTNKEEDLFLNYEAYQLKICAGLANFIRQMPQS